MPTTATDLWPENLLEARNDSPVDLLKAQADLLYGKTNNRLRGRVETGELSFGRSLKVISQGQESEIVLTTPAFAHSFQILVPKLKNYSYELLKIKHGVTLYPIAAQMAGEDGPPTLIKDEFAFQHWIQECLGSATARQVISTLLSVGK